MSEFVQTMKDWRRMCQHMGKEYGDNSCDRCRLEGCAAIYEDNGEMDYADVKNKVDAWAAEHPEPVYPSVAKYLERFGIIIRRDGTLEADFFKAHEPMSAYVANLLGVDLVEGENEKAD